MISVIPCLEVMKAVTDKNMSGAGVQSRIESFHTAVDLVSFNNCRIILEGKMYSKLEPRLNDDHKVFIQGSCIIDNSSKEVSEYNYVGAIKWIAQLESKIRKTIILGENNSYFEDIISDNVIFVKPSDFVYKSKRAKELFEKRLFVSFEDALSAVFFLN